MTSFRESQRTKFPGMKPIETSLVKRWLQEHEQEYDRFEYNVRVGPGRPLGPEYSDAVRKAGLMTSQLRIDVVAWKGDRPTLVELKNFATTPAIAQLGLYATLWRADHPGMPEPTLLIVCSACEAGLVNAALAANVAVQPVRALP
jgi:hypothetical protein